MPYKKEKYLWKPVKIRFMMYNEDENDSGVFKQLMKANGVAVYLRQRKKYYP